MRTGGLHLELRRSHPGRRDLVLPSDGRMNLWHNSHTDGRGRGKLVANRTRYVLLLRVVFFHYDADSDRDCGKGQNSNYHPNDCTNWRSAYEPGWVVCAVR